MKTMRIFYLFLAMMVFHGEGAQRKETISEVVARLEPLLRERAAAVRQLALPLPDSTFRQLSEAFVHQRVPIHAETEDCRTHSDLLVTAIANGETWALSILDAASKLHSGVLDGKLLDFGHHQQCLRVEEPHKLFKGQHCFVETRNILPQQLHLHLNYDVTDLPAELVRMLPEAKDLGFSLCVPSSCSARDIQIHMDRVLAPINASSVIHESSCSTDESVPFGFLEWFAISVFSGVIMLVSWATIEDKYSPKNKSALVSSFSLFRNWKRLTEVRASSEGISCLAGIRVYYTISTVLIHCFLKHLWASSVSPVTIEKEMGSFYIVWIEFGMRSPEVFLLIGGITRAFFFLQERVREKPFEFRTSVLRRYFRYTPTLAVIMLFSASLLMRCGSGPLWTRQTNISVWGCRNLWFLGILHIANLFYPRVSCVQHSWYLAIDFQLFVISPLFLFQLYYNHTVGLIMLATAASVALLANLLAAIATDVDAPSLAIMYKNRMGNEIVTGIYFSTLYRAFPYLLGMALGYFIFTIHQGKRRVVISKTVLWVGWVASITAVLLVFTASKVMLDPHYERIPWLDVGYSVLIKPVFTLVAAWTVTICHLGYGGILNDFLSWRGFQILSKIALGVYLVHFDILRIQANRLTIPFHYDNFYLLHNGIGVLLVSCLVAVLLFLCVESPCYSLVSHYLSRPSGANRKETDKPKKSLVTSDNNAAALKKQRRLRKTQ